MKFRLLLWVLGLMMGKASRTNPAFQQQLGDKDLAFMTGIQDKSIQIKGNPALVIWFQGLTKYLKPKKKQ